MITKSVAGCHSATGDRGWRPVLSPLAMPRINSAEEIENRDLLSSIFNPQPAMACSRSSPTPDSPLFASAQGPSTPPSRSPYISRPLYDGPADVNRFLEYRPAASRSPRRLAAPPFALRAIATS